ncbi:phosphatase PAP2 family protein [Candidatus Saccharibacteria bacterium]|nr:phosphatase PAP2 family protein [Candidatus Saccharibacteria bacterium]
MFLDSLRRIDYRLTETIQGWPPSWRPIMGGLTFLGEPLIVLAIGFTGFISAVQRSESRVQHAFFYGTLAFGINTLLKLLLHRRRPNDLRITTLGVRSYSFPSGHAFGTVIFYGLFAYLDYKYLNKTWHLVVTGLLIGIIGLIGISRVYLKAHYPSDVIGGWLLGLISLVVIIELAF